LAILIPNEPSRHSDPSKKTLTDDLALWSLAVRQGWAPGSQKTGNHSSNY
jgi:hypothetical protein